MTAKRCNNRFVPAVVRVMRDDNDIEPVECVDEVDGVDCDDDVVNLSIAFTVDDVVGGGATETAAAAAAAALLDSDTTCSVVWEPCSSSLAPDSDCLCFFFFLFFDGCVERGDERRRLSPWAGTAALLSSSSFSVVDRDEAVRRR